MTSWSQTTTAIANGFHTTPTTPNHSQTTTTTTNGNPTGPTTTTSPSRPLKKQKKPKWRVLDASFGLWVCFFFTKYMLTYLRHHSTSHLNTNRPKKQPKRRVYMRCLGFRYVFF